MKIPGCPGHRCLTTAVPLSWCSCTEGGGLSASGVQRQSPEKGNGQVSATESFVEPGDWAPTHKGGADGMRAREGLGKGATCHTDQLKTSRKQSSVFKGWGQISKLECLMSHPFIINFRIKLPAGLFPIELREKVLLQSPSSLASQPPNPSSSQPGSWSFAYSHGILPGSVFVQISAFAKTPIMLD